MRDSTLRAVKLIADSLTRDERRALLRSIASGRQSDAMIPRPFDMIPSTLNDDEFHKVVTGMLASSLAAEPVDIMSENSALTGSPGDDAAVLFALEHFLTDAALDHDSLDNELANVEFTGDTADAILSFFSSPANISSAGGLVTSFISGVKNLASGDGTVIQNIGTNLATGIQTGLQTAGDAIKSGIADFTADPVGTIANLAAQAPAAAGAVNTVKQLVGPTATPSVAMTTTTVPTATAAVPTATAAVPAQTVPVPTSSAQIGPRMPDGSFDGPTVAVAPVGGSLASTDAGTRDPVTESASRGTALPSAPSTSAAIDKMVAQYGLDPSDPTIVDLRAEFAALPAGTTIGDLLDTLDERSPGARNLILSRIPGVSEAALSAPLTGRVKRVISALSKLLRRSSRKPQMRAAAARSAQKVAEFINASPALAAFTTIATLVWLTTASADRIINLFDMFDDDELDAIKDGTAVPGSATGGSSGYSQHGSVRIAPVVLTNNHLVYMLPEGRIKGFYKTGVKLQEALREARFTMNAAFTGNAGLRAAAADWAASHPEEFGLHGGLIVADKLASRDKPAIAEVLPVDRDALIGAIESQAVGDAAPAAGEPITATIGLIMAGINLFRGVFSNKDRLRKSEETKQLQYAKKGQYDQLANSSVPFQTYQALVRIRKGTPRKDGDKAPFLLSGYRKVGDKWAEQELGLLDFAPKKTNIPGNTRRAPVGSDSDISKDPDKWRNLFEAWAIMAGRTSTISNKMGSGRGRLASALRTFDPILGRQRRVFYNLLDEVYSTRKAGEGAVTIPIIFNLPVGEAYKQAAAHEVYDGHSREYAEMIQYMPGSIYFPTRDLEFSIATIAPFYSMGDVSTFRGRLNASFGAYIAEGPAFNTPYTTLAPGTGYAPFIAALARGGMALATRLGGTSLGRAAAAGARALKAKASQFLATRAGRVASWTGRQVAAAAPFLALDYAFDQATSDDDGSGATTAAPPVDSPFAAPIPRSSDLPAASAGLAMYAVPLSGSPEYPGILTGELDGYTGSAITSSDLPESHIVVSSPRGAVALHVELENTSDYGKS